MVFDDEFSTDTLMREGKIPQNWIDPVQHISQSGAPENIDLEYTWFTTYIDEDTGKNPTHVPRFAPEINRNTITSSHSVQKVQ